MGRRSYLALAGAALGTAAVAGCLGGGDGPEGGRQVRFGYGGGPYLFAVGSAALAAATGENEPNDACANAQAISTGTEVSATLESADVDWYSFDLAAGEDYHIVYDRVPNKGVTNVVLYGPDCTFKTMHQVGNSKQISVSGTAQESGTHYVEIVDVHNGDGAYTVRVESEASTATSTPTATDTATSTPTATDTATSTPTATTVADDYGEQGYGKYGYGGLSN